jgi:hypothetical protein
MEINEGSDRHTFVPDYVPRDLLDEHQREAFHQVHWSAYLAQLRRRSSEQARSRRRWRWLANQVTVTAIVSGLLAAGIWGAANRSVPALAVTAAAAVAATAAVALAAVWCRRARRARYPAT